LRPGARLRRAFSLQRTGKLLRVWRRGIAAAMRRAGINAGDFFRQSWRILRTEGLPGVARHSWQFFVTQSFPSLTRRLVFLNVFGLFALVVSFAPLNQVRAGLIEASVRSLQVQGEMIAGAIAGAATVESDSTITVNPNRLLDLQAGETYGPTDDF